MSSRTLTRDAERDLARLRRAVATAAAAQARAEEITRRLLDERPRRVPALRIAEAWGVTARALYLRLQAEREREESNDG